MPLYNDNTACSYAASTRLLTQIHILIIKQLDLTELERIQVPLQHSNVHFFPSSAT